VIQRHWTAALPILAAIICGAPIAQAQVFRGRMMNASPAPGAGGTVTLPYVFSDGNTTWRIYNNGWLQQNGNMPIYSQGAMLTLNGNQPTQSNNQGRIDPKTGELIIENMHANGLTVTRRILLDKDAKFVRYIDIFHNGGGQPQQANISVQSNLNYGVNTAQFVADPKKKDQNIAWVAQTGAGQSVVEMYGGKNAKIVPALNWPQGNNWVQATLNISVPPGKDVAFMHLHHIVPTQDAGVQFVNNLKESRIMHSIPAALRRIIINFPSAQGWIGDIELLRGDLLDVVELHSGDQVKGTLKEPAYNLQTFYGAVSVPVEKVVGIINVGQFRPRQLLVASDGEIFGGRLKKETLDLQLSSGQVTQIPLSQVSRAGYRKRAGEPEEWKFDKPMIVLRTGERMVIKMPAAPLEVDTRYGKLSLQPETVAAVSLQNEDNGVHEIYLTDGSKFAGLLRADTFDFTLASGDQAVKFPASTVAKLQFSPNLAEADDLTPTIRLGNDDLLVGTLTGKLNLDTAFDTIAVNATEIKSLTRAKESVQDVQVVLWDGTSLSGQLRDPELACLLKSGVSMKAPVALVEEYSQPQPQPSASMTLKIKSVIADLNADDWKQRDRAQAALVSMGPVAESVLKELRPKQPPEAQKAIDIVLQKLEEQRKKEKTTKPTAAANGGRAAGVVQQVEEDFTGDFQGPTDDKGGV